MSALELYLLIKLDAIIEFIGWLTTPVSLVAVAAFVIYFMSRIAPIIYYSMDDSTESGLKEIKAKCKSVHLVVFKVFLIAALIWLPLRLTVALLPSTKEMAVIYVVPKVINNQSVQQLPNKLLHLSSEWLDELRPENVKKSIETII